MSLRTIVRALDAVISLVPQSLLGGPKNLKGYRLSPLLRVILRAQARKKVDMGNVEPEQLRREMRSQLLPLRAVYQVGQVRDLSIDLEGRSLKARHYVPSGKEPAQGLTVYFHGGGYIFGDLDTHDDVCRLLCREANTQIVSVDYRLAPEHPFPAGLMDAIDAFRWVQKHADDFGVKPSEVAVGGDSAGGNLAAVLAQTTSSNAAPAAQLLLYPGTDQATKRPSHLAFGEGFFLDNSDRAVFRRHYLQGRQDASHDPQVSPFLGEISEHIAPALIATAGFDVLHDEGEAYANKLVRAGCCVDYMCFEHLGHGFANLVGIHRASEKALIEIGQRWGRLCEQRTAN